MHIAVLFWGTYRRFTQRAFTFPRSLEPGIAPFCQMSRRCPVFLTGCVPRLEVWTSCLPVLPSCISHQTLFQNDPSFVTKTKLRTCLYSSQRLCLMFAEGVLTGSVCLKKSPVIKGSWRSEDDLFPSRLVSFLLLANVVFNFTRKTINGREFL